MNLPNIYRRKLPSGIELLDIETSNARASISLFGGQVLSWQPRHTAFPVLWLSESASYDMRKAIRGGAPVCWPWFGASPTSTTLPAHGVARISDWELERCSVTSDGSAALTLTLASTSLPAGYRTPLRLSQTVRIGDSLSITLHTRNSGTTEQSYTEGLHTYFLIGDVADASVVGLDGCVYADLTADNATRTQQGAVRFGNEIARLFLGTGHACELIDARMGRRIRVEKSGSRSTAIWNPGLAVAGAMPDLGTVGWRSMVCVETANALEDAVVIAPGESKEMTAEYFVESLPSSPSPSPINSESIRPGHSGWAR